MSATRPETRRPSATSGLSVDSLRGLQDLRNLHDLARPRRLRADHAQRERTVAFLGDAYAAGQLTEPELDERVTAALAATYVDDLTPLTADLIGPRSGLARMTGAHPVHQPFISQERQSSLGSLALALTHWSALFTWLAGPGLVYLLSPVGSRVRRGAREALNFQITATFIMMGLTMMAAVLDLPFVLGVAGLAWAITTIVGGVRAGQGEEWVNPLKRLTGWELIKEPKPGRPGYIAR
ncbi:DUF1707 and DUF4870 domain-containing protein [Parenemella sanctibonifatiensis]|uniref:DUF1707 domain-containing protein n=1 Tax=Parenemella sanctibonifatiensis TaxID=2016505 RepID=A0A255EH53_9ACTN|nr:DUF1707 and DUF4870 domain-containing protein [Parenemella sanctibonifatiensis]OYN90869.1 hypothetical protein CGZ91_05085 [Parenemella sanctibonifatiensis]